MSECYKSMRIDSDGTKHSLIVYVSHGGAAELDFEEGMPANLAVMKLRDLADRLEWLLNGDDSTSSARRPGNP